jgi:formylglycine-generating enzyme required for sulfatase activity
MKVFVVAVALGLALASPAVAANRVALVIGNDAYTNLPPLEKAVNDARAVAAALEEIGFKVLLGEDLTRRETNRKLADFEAAVEPGDTAFFFFAGHGVAIGGENLLIPTDMPKPGPGEGSLVRDEAHAVTDLAARVQARGAAAAFFVLDACRDNPFAAAGVRGIGGGRGLTRVDAPSGVFMLFSAGIGQTALDTLPSSDPHPNSVFTRTLAPLLTRPGLGHVRLAKLVQGEVSALAARVPHLQQPAYYDQIIGEIVLAPGAATEFAPDDAGSSGAGDAAAALAWQAVEDTASPAVLEGFVAAFPESVYASFARARLTELQEQKVAVGIGEPPDFSEFGIECSEGVIAPVAGEPRCLKPGDTFRDCDECSEMVVIPAGSFMMGSPESEEGRSPDEGPQHKVSIPEPFAVGRFEVTFDEWEACAADGGCAGHEPPDEGWGRGRRPVIHVSWDNAQAYVAWLSARTGQDYRLLSEAEWEYAARAGDTTRFFFGDDETRLCNFANGADRSATTLDARNMACSDGFGDMTAPVGAFAANTFRLHDMLGNVWEWTQDCWRDSYSGASGDGAARTDGDCASRVVRGGSWAIIPRGLRSAFRAYLEVDYRDDDVGFRVARSLSPHALSNIEPDK